MQWNGGKGVLPPAPQNRERPTAGMAVRCPKLLLQSPDSVPFLLKRLGGGEQPRRVQTPALRSWGVKGRRDLGKEMKKQCGVEGGLVQNIGEKLGDKFILIFVLKVS